MSISFLKKDLFILKWGLGFKQRGNSEGSSGQRESKGSAQRQINHCHGRLCPSLIWPYNEYKFRRPIFSVFRDAFVINLLLVRDHNTTIL